MTTKTVALAVVLVSLILTHAAFVDYRSWNASGRRVAAPASEAAVLQQDGYLKERRYAGFDVCVSGSYRGAWKGGTRSKWTELGLCNGVFELLVLMKGGLTRLLILDALANQPKNKLQLADQLAIDWKAVDRHIEKLLEYNLVQPYITVGTCTLFTITEKGKHALALAGEHYSGG